MKIEIEIKNLKYKNILKNISFKIEKNSFNFLIGPNGSGKTTLIKCLAGLLEYEGQIIYSEEILNKNTALKIRKKMGIISEFNILLDGSVMDNILFPLINLDYEENESKKLVYAISKKFNISYLLTKNVDELNRREKKLVSLAIALVHDPQIIIIDDYLDEFDYEFRKNLIKYLKQKKATVIFVTNKTTDINLEDDKNKFIFLESGQITYLSNEEVIKDENIFIKKNVSMPFILDLSSKLQTYELIDKKILNKEELVDALWK